MLTSRSATFCKLTESVDASAIEAEMVVVIPAYAGTILPATFSFSTVILPSFEDKPSGKAKIVPVAVGVTVDTPRFASNDVSELTFVTTNDPLY